MATSPPFPVHSVPPPSKKRPSIATDLYPAAKRRKPSIASATSGFHPLRQTTFPNETEASPPSPPPVHSPPPNLPRGSNIARSPSVESSLTAGGMGRVRKSKSKARSTTGGSVRRIAKAKSVANLSTKGGVPGGKSNKGDEGTTVRDDEGDEEDEEVDTAEGVDGVEKVDEDQERQKLRILVESFTPDQSDRYDLFRRVKLNPAVVKKIVNQTLSQSVTDSVVKTVNGFTKVFIGEIMERAREVQAQWEAVASSQESSSSSQTLEGNSQPQPQKRNLGPLLPDHMREALRRYRRDKEGGGAGMRGLSSAAMERGKGYSSATGGRRLFR
ncbi:MAG: hypothetical protein M1816_003722 [Peltula sp. TS41687]|nr:MAG: hypothetical protein M1816_003722 [Peltula sp. TS41687]